MISKMMILLIATYVADASYMVYDSLYPEKESGGFGRMGRVGWGGRKL